MDEASDSTSASVTARDASPRRTTSLRARGKALAAPVAQRRLLDALDLGAAPHAGSFDAALLAAGLPDGLRPAPLEIVQINVGKLCNMTCAHCHVDAGPDRTTEMMTRETMDACLRLVDRVNPRTVDITGGAPELNPHFRWLVDACVERGVHVIDRCNLTVLLLPRCEDLPRFLADRGVEVACSLPHPRRANTDAQRGTGTFDKSLEALRLLNAAGYGSGDPRRMLTLVSNPAGAFLAGDQSSLEREWKDELSRRHGVSFDRLSLLNNMPISRFLDWLLESGNVDAYMRRLLEAFNPATIPGLMCRTTISISWDGRLFDCDFNQMLDIECAPGPARVGAFDADALARRRIRTARHCFGCTAGAGSSCGGAIAVGS
jgi:radical SAM/Cys-rich protein